MRLYISSWSSFICIFNCVIHQIKNWRKVTNYFRHDKNNLGHSEKQSFTIYELVWFRLFSWIGVMSQVIGEGSSKWDDNYCLLYTGQSAGEEWGVDSIGTSGGGVLCVKWHKWLSFSIDTLQGPGTPPHNGPQFPGRFSGGSPFPYCSAPLTWGPNRAVPTCSRVTHRQAHRCEHTHINYTLLT